MNKINLSVGDHSCDGHELNETYTIESNMTLPALQKAYKIGTKKVGFDFTSTVAVECEDNILSVKQLAKLRSLGFDGEISDEEVQKEVFADLQKKKKKKKIWVDIDVSLEEMEYISIVLFICKLGEPSFEYKFIYNNNPNWELGGYGLFY